jgi:hypothetical protein
MSIYSTSEIAREYALSRILSKLTSATDSQLADIMFTLFSDEEFLNYTIVENVVEDK